MKRYIKASTDVNTLYRIAHDLFNELMQEHSRELKEHTADSLIASSITDTLSDDDINTVIEYVYGITDGYFDMHDNFYGYNEYKKYGDIIYDVFHGWYITKRRDNSDLMDYKQYVAGLGAASEKLNIPIYFLLSAIEGMCHEQEAVEVDDSNYFIGTPYDTWGNVDV